MSNPKPVPYGEAPLAGARLERLRDMIAQLKAGGFRGKVKVATFVGEFCLVGNGIEGYSMAADDLPASRCDLRGNPFDDGLSTAQRQSLPFANLVARSARTRASQLRVEVEHEGRQPRGALSARRPTRESHCRRLEQDRRPEQPRRICRSAGGVMTRDDPGCSTARTGTPGS